MASVCWSDVFAAPRDPDRRLTVTVTVALHGFRSRADLPGLSRDLGRRSPRCGARPELTCFWST
jgi:hypothetical protein